MPWNTYWNKQRRVLLKTNGLIKVKQEAHEPHHSPEEVYIFSISFYKLAIISDCSRAWLFI